jgi:hypothetical protein
MTPEKRVCKAFEGTGILFKNNEKITDKKDLRIDKCIYFTDNQFDMNSVFDEINIYLPKDLSQYPTLFNDIFDRKERGIRYTLQAEVKQTYFNSVFYKTKERGIQIVEISNIKPQDLIKPPITSEKTNVKFNAK